MAKTHHDDDRSKKPGADPAKAPTTPKYPLPNMSLDDDEPPAVEEVMETEPAPLAEPIPAVESASDVLMADPVQEAMPASAVEPFVLADAEVVEAAPVDSDVFLADDVEEVVEAEPIAEEAVRADDVVEVTEASAVVEAEPVAVESHAEAAPASDVDLMSLLAEASAKPAEEPGVEAIEETAPVVEEEPLAVEATEEAAPIFEEEPVAAEAIEEAAPTFEEEPVAAEAFEEAAPTFEDEPVAAEAFEEAAPFVDEEPVVEAFEEAAPLVEEEPVVEAFDEPEAAPLAEPVVAAESHEPGAIAEPFEGAMAPATPASGVKPYENIFADEIAAADEPVAAAPHSEVVAAEEPIATAPHSEVVAAEEPIATAPHSEVIAHEPIEHAPEAAALADEAMPESAVIADEPVEEVAQAMPESAVIADDAFEEVVEAMPESAVIVDDEVAEAMPESAVIADEAVEAMPESAVIADDEFAEAMPESAVIADEAVEAMPESAVVADEAFDEVAEAAPESGVIFDDEVAEALPESAAVAEEAVEEVVEAAEASSATRKSEAVLGDEADALEATEASGVVFDDLPIVGASAKKKGKDATKAVDLDQTMAFQPPSSAAKKSGDDDLLVTEEEVVGASEASAVDLGDVHAKKGSSVTGIDKVAEALESGVDLGATAPPEPSVEFDEILDEDVAEAEEADLGTVEEPIVGKKKPGKKGKGTPQATGEDIDLNDLFGDEEVAEAAEAEEAEEAAEATDFDEEAAEADEATEFDSEEVAEAAEAEEAEEAEAAEAFDEEAEEAEAAEAFDEEVEAAESAEDDELADFDADEKPVKSKTQMGKKTRVHDEDEEAEAEAAEDEDEDVSAKKKGKKGKKEKEKATVAPAASSGYGCFTVIIAMFLTVLLIAGGLAGAWFGATDQIRDLAKAQLDLHEKAPPRVVPPLEKASDALAKGKYAEAIAELKNPGSPEEFNLRGEARWFAYVKDKKNALDKDAPEVKDALSDLQAGKNEVLAEQIRTQVDLPNRDKLLNDKLTKLEKEKETAETDLANVTKEKEVADKKIDTLADVLAKGKIIEDKTKLDAAVVEKVLKALDADKATLITVNKLLKDAEIKGDGDKGVEEVIKLKTDAEKNVLAVNKVLEDEKIKEKGDKGVLEIIEARNKTIKDRDDLLKTVSDAFKEFIDGKIVPENADARKSIVEGAKLARQKAESPLSIPLAQLGMSLGGIGTGTSKVVGQTFDLSKVFSELGFFRTREPFIQTPQEKMDTHMALLADRKKNDAKELGAITREADWVLSKDSKADEESRSKARFVQGLALRNLEKFADARTAFEETLERLKPLNKAAAWSKAVTNAHREITDPTAYYLPRMAMFRAEKNYKAAFDEANTALKAMPNDARLYAQRGLIRLEAVRGQKIADDVQKEIRADAATAAKDEKVAAESAHLVGLLEEDLGNWPEAERNFRDALKLHQGPLEDAGKYRISLARLLLRDRSADAPVVAPPQPEEKKKDDAKDEKKLDKKDDGKDEKKLDKKDDAKDEKKDGEVSQAPAVERTIVMHPLSTLFAAMLVAQPVEEVDDKETLARVNETIKLAQELIASKNDKLKGQGYLLMGSALSKLGKRTEGLKEYAKGLKLVYPGIETKEIDALINEHPAFQQPDISGTPNPVMAERHFGEGMHLYWSKDFEKAEAQFKTAVKYFEKDARYQYYLGLSQLAQKSKLKRDAAYYSFEVGARLEAKSVSTNPYAARDINMSLERIQGPVRELLNGFRFKALDPEGDAKTPAPE